MKWVNNFHLFLFDFDGLLVNTEKLHYSAYKQMCAQRGFNLPWDFAKYSSFALFDATAIQKALYKEFPALQQHEPNWSVLYNEKKKAYLDLLQTQEKLLLPGAEELLKELSRLQIKRCVVTHSPKEQVDLIALKNPILKTIPFWITRQDYTNPKPDPECYLKAIERYGQKGDRIIGFEDSPRGFQALHATSATSVFVSDVIGRKEAQKYASRPFHHFPSLLDVLQTGIN